MGMEMAIYVSRFNGLRSIFSAVSHSNGTALQFISFSRKGMRLEVMNHLKFVFDITKEQIGRGQLVTLFGRQQLLASQPIK